MKTFIRKITPDIQQSLRPGRVTVLYGPRRVGKTTIIRMFLKEGAESVLLVNGDEIATKRALSSQDSATIKEFIGDHRLVIIDEAQQIPNIGINLKILVDTFPEIKVLATGSATFDLANKISEPLTGRKKVFTLYPLSFGELSVHYSPFEAKQRLERWLIWGGYPQAVLARSMSERAAILQEITSSYLFRDVLDVVGVKAAEKIVDLLRLLALQIGSQVSLSGLANQLNMDFRTVEKYLEFLEQSFVIYHLRGFSRNLRKEVAKSSKYYFYDNGIRNALIENFNPLSVRGDVGQLWENYLMIERQKAMFARGQNANRYFWRTYDQQELDLIEESGGKLRGYEFKWSDKKKPRAPKAWLATYENASYRVINQNNYAPFIG